MLIINDNKQPLYVQLLNATNQRAEMLAMHCHSEAAVTESSLRDIKTRPKMTQFKKVGKYYRAERDI